MDLMMYGAPKMAGFGESVFCESYAYIPGGKGANQAVAAAKLGADVAMVGRLGDDENGRALIENLERSGVDTTGVVHDPKRQTGLAAITVDRDSGKYICYVAIGANDWIEPRQVERALCLRNYDMVLMQLEMPLETVYRSYELAGERGIPVFLDAGPAMNIPLDRLKGIFILSPNEAETEALTGISTASPEGVISAAKSLFSRVDPKYVLLKLGARGALLYDGQAPEWIPCFDRIDVVDTTAAGDTFGAAFAVRYIGNGDVRDAVRYAHAAAGVCVSRKGAQSSMPSVGEVESFLSGR